jgi:excisionase family DNA binding protein
VTISGSRVQTRPRIPTRSEWMSIHEASTLMGVSPATLRRWSDAGEIHAFTTPGGHRRFSRAAVASLLPTNLQETASGDRRRELVEVANRIDWFPDLDPARQRAMRRHARRISAAVAESMDAEAAEQRASSLADAESSAAACGVLAAASGVGLRETAEAFLGFRACYLRALMAASVDGHGAIGASAAAIAAATDAFDHLVSRAMRAHEGSSGRS